jgi:DNA-binding transcriptional MerR regulator
MKVKDVAELLGVSEQTIRIGLQRGLFPFGVAFKRDEGNQHYTYILYPEKVKEYLGQA